MVNKKKYFDRKHNEDLIAYDNNLQVNDLVDNATSKTMSNIRRNKQYQKGQNIGHDLKKKYKEGHDKKIDSIGLNFIQFVSVIIWF